MGLTSNNGNKAVATQMNNSARVVAFADKLNKQMDGRKSKKSPLQGHKVAPKYRLTVGKQIHEWTGRGRMPLVFKEFVEKGNPLEKCLIKR